MGVLSQVSNENWGKKQSRKTWPHAVWQTIGAAGEWWRDSSLPSRQEANSWEGQIKGNLQGYGSIPNPVCYFIQVKPHLLSIPKRLEIAPPARGQAFST